MWGHCMDAGLFAMADTVSPCKQVVGAGYQAKNEESDLAIIRPASRPLLCRSCIAFSQIISADQS